MECAPGVHHVNTMQVQRLAWSPPEINQCPPGTHVDSMSERCFRRCSTSLNKIKLLVFEEHVLSSCWQMLKEKLGRFSIRYNKAKANCEYNIIINNLQHVCNRRHLVFPPCRETYTPGTSFAATEHFPLCPRAVRPPAFLQKFLPKRGGVFPWTNGHAIDLGSHVRGTNICRGC